MEINFDKQQKNLGVIKISVNKTDFQPRVDQKIKEYSKTANFKGFRPGKVPPGLIRKMYGNALIVEEINRLVSEKLDTYLKNSDLQFLGEPIPIQKDKSFDWENEEPFEFEYEVGFAEPFKIVLDKKFKIYKYSVKINDEVINDTVENLQRQFGEVEQTDIANEKDTLTGQVTSKDRVIKESLNIDLRNAKKATLEKLIGIRIGEEVQINLKKGFKNEIVIKNQLKFDEEEFKKLEKIKFKVEVINHYKLAPIDQNLFDKTFGKDRVKDESSFREKLKATVTENYSNEEEQFFNHQIREKLIKNSKISIPDDFLKKWLEKSSNVTTPEFLDSRYNLYAKDLKWSLIQDLIIKNKEIKIEHNDIVSEARILIKKQLVNLNIENQENDQIDAYANSYLQDENSENYIKVFNQVRSNKVFNFIKGEISIKEREVSLDEFRKL
ncbi:MAG: trigger factor [Bacteroidota bacterium]